VEKHLSSRPAEILLSIDRGANESLRAQIERQLRDQVRSGALRPGSEIPSTRELALELGVSRPLIMEAYAQLAAEGYLALRQGAAPRVSQFSAPAARPPLTVPESSPPLLRYDFRPGIPDLASFPKKEWLKATAAALDSMTAQNFGYSERYGVAPLREALADYLGRVRGVSAAPEQILVTSGFEQARSFIARALWEKGVRRIAVENPGYADRAVFLDLGFELLPVPVDAEGLDVGTLAELKAQALLTTPAHQYPAGVVMSGARRLAIAAWLRRSNAIAIEDDYDAEFRYDRSPIGALQGLAPEHVLYAGTVSKTLAPALRLGWLVAPPELVEPLRTEMQFDYGRSRIEQHALAYLLKSGAFDRHLRRMRAIYATRRQTLLAAIAAHLPEAEVSGVAAGLHVAATLASKHDEATVIELAARRGIGISFMTRHFLGPSPKRSTLLLSYAGLSEAGLRAGIKGVAAVLAGWTEGPVNPI
jgi:GntR family transcriptional regulator/MocR family aminotransferase